MAKPAVEVGQEVRVTEGGLQGCEGLVLSVEQSGHGDHGSGKREWICKIRLTRSSRYDYSVDQTVKLWSYKLQPLIGRKDPNYLFGLRKGPKRIIQFNFKCRCGWVSVNPIRCPNCDRTRTCSECGLEEAFESQYGTCVDCGEKYRA